MRTGTSHFVSFAAAWDYYLGQKASDVQAKLDSGEIHIGKPKAGPGEVVSVIPGEGRYQVESPDRPATGALKPVGALGCCDVRRDMLQVLKACEQHIGNPSRIRLVPLLDTVQAVIAKAEAVSRFKWESKS